MSTQTRKRRKARQAAVTQSEHEMFLALNLLFGAPDASWYPPPAFRSAHAKLKQATNMNFSSHDALWRRYKLWHEGGKDQWGPSADCVRN